MTGESVSTSWNRLRWPRDAALVRRHATDIVGVLGGQVGVQIVQDRAHLVGVLLVNAEYERLGKAVCLRHVGGKVASNGFGAGTKGNDALEVLRVVLAIGNFATVAIHLPLCWTPPSRIGGCDDAMHAIGRREAVLDALAEGVRVDGITEVLVGVAIVVAQGRGRHAELGRRSVVLQDLAPGAVRAG